MNNIIKRILTGLVFVIIVVGAIVVNKWLFLFLFLGIIGLGMNEFYNLISQKNINTQKIFGISIGAAVFAFSYYYVQNLINNKIFLLLILFVLGVFVAELYRKKENPFTNIAFTIMAILYIAVPFTLVNYIVFANSPINYNPNLLLGFLFLIWSYDSFE